jgi:chromosome segregation ATPase
MRSSHQDEKRRLEEAYKKLTEELRELHEQRSILQQSHEDERISLQATFEEEKESLQNIIQEKADVLEKLQTAELAKTTAVKDHGALLDRIREMAKHAQCQISETAPDPQPVKKKGLEGEEGGEATEQIGHPIGFHHKQGGHSGIFRCRCSGPETDREDQPAPCSRIQHPQQGRAMRGSICAAGINLWRWQLSLLQSQIERLQVETKFAEMGRAYENFDFQSTRLTG